MLQWRFRLFIKLIVALVAIRCLLILSTPHPNFFFWQLRLISILGSDRLFYTTNVKSAFAFFFIEKNVNIESVALFFLFFYPLCILLLQCFYMETFATSAAAHAAISHIEACILAYTQGWCNGQRYRANIHTSNSIHLHVGYGNSSWTLFFFFLYLLHPFSDANKFFFLLEGKPIISWNTCCFEQLKRLVQK